MLRRRIALELSRSLVSPWTPPFCKTKRVAWSGTQGDWWLEGSESVHPFHASDLQAPKGTGDLTVRIPKGKLNRSNYSILPIVVARTFRMMVKCSAYLQQVHCPLTSV